MADEGTDPLKLGVKTPLFWGKKRFPLRAVQRQSLIYVF